MKRTRVFIWGSCVSRDTFEHVAPGGHELVRYVARQSAVSVANAPVTMIDPPELNSRFQRRMVAGDFDSSLERELTALADKIDLLLVDLVDERLGFYLLPDGSVLTRSVELIQAGGEELLPEGSRYLAFGTDEHFDLWAPAIRSVGELINRLVPDAEVVLLDLPWAESSAAGEPTPASFGVTAQEANERFRRYGDLAKHALSARTIRIEAAEVASGPNHPWGETPFHYTEDVYLRVVEALTGRRGREVWASGVAPPSPHTEGDQPGEAAHEPLPARRPRRATAALLVDAISKHGWSIGDHTYGRPTIVGAGAASLTIGKYCWFERDSHLLLTQRRLDAVSLYSFHKTREYWPSGQQHIPETVSGSVEIGNDVRVSSGAHVGPGVTVGDGAYIAPGCVVTEDVPPYAIMVGNPGRILGYRFTSDQTALLLSIAWWHWPDAEVDAALPEMAKGIAPFLNYAQQRGTRLAEAPSAQSGTSTRG